MMFANKSTDAASDSLVSKSELVALYREALSSGMSLLQLNTKVDRMMSRLAVTQVFEQEDTTERVTTIRRQLPLWVKLGAFSLPVIFIVVGLFLVGNAVVPFMQYYTSSVASLAQADLLSPLPREQMLDIAPTVINTTRTGQTLAFSGVQTDAGQRPTFIDTQLDYTNLANWFTNTDLVALTQNEGAATEYVLDIPKLNIANAVVSIGGTDLDQSLIQYPGTADPGSAGAPVIFGHSVLRQFYNPSENNPRRYISIFSTIMTLSPGDEIFVTYEGVKYKYVMREKMEVKPEDVHILMQNYDSRQLKLVTCTPEGTYLRRGVVVAQLVTE
jgi:LPXTG-site transpeptidase (sortase) family protein